MRIRITNPLPSNNFLIPGEIYEAIGGSWIMEGEIKVPLKWGMVIITSEDKTRYTFVSEQEAELVDEV